jgi:hypothetical protein
MHVLKLVLKLPKRWKCKTLKMYYQLRERKTGTMPWICLNEEIS